MGEMTTTSRLSTKNENTSCVKKIDELVKKLKIDQERQKEEGKNEEQSILRDNSISSEISIAPQNDTQDLIFLLIYLRHSLRRKK